MKHLQIFAILISVSIIGVNTHAQEEQLLTTVRLTDKIYQISSDQGDYTTNTLVSVGEDGILIVDTQTENEAEELKQIIDSFGKGAPKYIINTHSHIEHIGGNAIFGTNPVVIAHELYPSKLISRSHIIEEFPPATYPDITLADSISLFFNGERIRIIDMGGSHDDNEIIVHFTESKIVHLSSLCNGFNFPSIDSDGDVFKFPEIIRRAIEIVPKDAVIVSGHNDNGGWQEFHPYLEMLESTIDIIGKGLEAGKDLATLQEEKVIDKWKSYAGSYVSVNDWINYIVSGYETKGEPEKKNIFKPLYYAIKDGGVEAGLSLFGDIKLNHADEYNISDAVLLVIADKYLGKGKVEDAIKLLELNISEYPSVYYGYYSHYVLAKAYDERGNKEKALYNCEKSLELNSEFQMAKELLEKLKSD
ncbi:MAG: MBL fold metallo-hydrolase [candidate division Zixibacteria bacterium]